MTKERWQKFLPLLLFFIISNVVLLTGSAWMGRMDMDRDVVIGGNALLFLVTLISFTMALRGLSNPNPHAFVRSVYTSMMLKLFACAIAAFVYISAAGKALNKPALFACMGLYLVYTFMEVSVLTKLLKQKPNA